MNGKYNKYLTFLLVTAILLANSALSWAFEGDFENIPTADEVEMASESETDVNINDLEVEAGDEEIPGDEDGEEEIPTEDLPEDFIARLKQELDLTKADYHQMLNSVTDAQKRLELVSEERLSLNEQLANLQVQEKLLTGKLVAVLQQIVERENAINQLNEEVESRTIALEYQKDLLRDYVRLIYQEENDFFNYGDDEGNAFKLLLSDGNVADNLRQLDYFNLINEAGLQIAYKLDELNKDLSGKEEKLSKEKEKLDELRVVLIAQKDQLEMQKESQNKLLQITEGQESVYEQLIEEEFSHQEQLVKEIQALRDIYLAAETKYREDPDNFNIEDYDITNLDVGAKAVYDFQVENLDQDACSFQWPIEPSRGLSTFFRNDGDGYLQRFGMVHNAIDVPAYQGTAISAPAEGVVYMAKDNGYGYSYIILSHACGFTTTYGHISEILVEPGQYVEPGTIIGLSGGMPGTPGAGYMTTGPHLHMEMRLNGMYIDPLEHLPLEKLERDDLLEKYQAPWDMAVLRLQKKELE